MTLTLDHCRFASRFLLYCAENGLITWSNFNRLMASVRRHERSLVSCEGKAGFTSFKLADKVARRMGRHEEGGYMKPYGCPNCHLFHLTEKTAAQRRAEELVRAKRQAVHDRGFEDLADA